MDSLHPALRRGATLSLLVLLTLVFAACGGGNAGTGDNGDGGNGGTDGGGTATVTDGVAEVSADNLEFDVSTIEAPAGEPFVIRLTNSENVPHNISVYTEEGGEVIAQGDVINEGETDELEVEALEPGEYFFVCDLHPAEMTGTLVVGG